MKGNPLPDGTIPFQYCIPSCDQCCVGACLPVDVQSLTVTDTSVYQGRSPLDDYTVLVCAAAAASWAPAPNTRHGCWLWGQGLAGQGVDLRVLYGATVMFAVPLFVKPGALAIRAHHSRVGRPQVTNVLIAVLAAESLRRPPPPPAAEAASQYIRGPQRPPKYGLLAQASQLPITPPSPPCPTQPARVEVARVAESAAGTGCVACMKCLIAESKQPRRSAHGYNHAEPRVMRGGTRGGGWVVTVPAEGRSQLQ